MEKSANRGDKIVGIFAEREQGDSARIVDVFSSAPASLASSKARTSAAVSVLLPKARNCMNSRRSSVTGVPSAPRPFSRMSIGSCVSVVISILFLHHRRVGGARTSAKWCVANRSKAASNFPTRSTPCQPTISVWFASHTLHVLVIWAFVFYLTNSDTKGHDHA